MPNKCVSHINFPKVTVRLLMHVRLRAFFDVVVVEPENIFAHANNI